MQHQNNMKTHNFRIQEDRRCVADVSLSVIYAELLSIKDEVGELKQDLTRYRGFAGGLLWAGSALAAFMGFVISWVK